MEFYDQVLCKPPQLACLQSQTRTRNSVGIMEFTKEFTYQICHLRHTITVITGKVATLKAFFVPTRGIECNNRRTGGPVPRPSHPV